MSNRPNWEAIARAAKKKRGGAICKTCSDARAAEAVEIFMRLRATGESEISYDDMAKEVNANLEGRNHSGSAVLSHIKNHLPELYAQVVARERRNRSA